MKTIRVKAEEGFRTLNPGDLVTFAFPLIVDYKPTEDDPIATIEIVAEITFKNDDGVLTAFGPLSVSGHPDFRNHPDTQKRFDKLMRE